MWRRLLRLWKLALLCAITAVVLALSACAYAGWWLISQNRGDVSEDELYGVWVRHSDGLDDVLTLSPDGTFSQIVSLDDKPIATSGKWTFDHNDTAAPLRLERCIVVSDGLVPHEIGRCKHAIERRHVLFGEPVIGLLEFGEYYSKK